MRDSLKSNVTWPSLSWLVPLAFLALPDCSFDGVSPDPNLDRGDAPHTALVHCDLENQNIVRRCAGTLDLDMGIPLESAALSLVRNNKYVVALDYRPEAAAEAGLACPSGTPVAITFQNVFPDGSQVCLSTAQVFGSGTYDGDPNKICKAWCFDQFGDFDSENQPSQEIKTYCSEKARGSTNAHPLNNAFLNACTDGGAPRPDFQDPRRRPEPVYWNDRIGVAVSGGDNNTLTRTAPETGMFDAGAASFQVITRGDAYVEFTLAEATTTRACGLSSVGPVDPETGQPGPDLDPTLATIGFAVRAVGNNLLIHENSGPGAGILVGTYEAGDRIRVAVRDNLDGTGRITYSRILASCTMGPLCTGMELLSSTVAAPYPFRVDSSLRTLGASLTNVVLVRIK